MIPFYRPYYDQTELLSLLQPGRDRAEFESAVATRAGAKYAITFSYGRAGLLAACRALGLTEVEIIIPAYLCHVVARPLVTAGNHLRFVDINLTDYNLDLDQLKQAITPQTRAIIAVHMYGYPVDVAAIRAALGDERIMIIEDSAQAPFRFSPESDLTLFSFGVAKPLTTVEGGVIVTNSADIYEKIKAHRDQEMNQNDLRAYADRYIRLATNYILFNQWVYPLWLKIRRYHRPAQTAKAKVTASPARPTGHLPTDIGLAYKNFQARLGLAQLGKLEAILARRHHLAHLYDQELAGIPHIQPAPLVSEATYAYYTIRVPQRDESGFRQRMTNQGVAVDRTYEYILPELNPYLSFAQGTYPGAAQAAREVINLPCYPDLSDAQVRYIAACVRTSIHEIQKDSNG